MIPKKLLPDIYLDDIYSIDLDGLAKRGIKALILDIDNTLVTYDDPEPTEPVAKWFGELEKRGISFAFVSNNNANRVGRFNSGLGCPAFPKAGKPSVKKINEALGALGALPEETASVGDQVFTDVLAANRAGLYSVLVKPIKDKKSLFFRFKRLLERPVIAKYRKETQKND